MTGAVAHIAVLTSCTGSKICTTTPVPAENLYAGQQHLRLMRGVDVARTNGVRVDVAIVSAGHGVVPGGRSLPTYEQTFQGMRADARRALARRLNVPGGARWALRRPADLHVVLLGDDYLEACELDAGLRPSAPVLVFCAAGAALRLPPINGVHIVPLTTEDTRRFSCGLVALKGEVGGRLLSHVAAIDPPLSRLTGPGLLHDLANARPRATPTASTLF